MGREGCGVLKQSTSISVTVCVHVYVCRYFVLLGEIGVPPLLGNTTSIMSVQGLGLGANTGD